MRREKGDTLTVKGREGPIQVTRYELLGNNLLPSTMMVDARGDLFAEVRPTFVVIRKVLKKRANG